MDAGIQGIQGLQCNFSMNASLHTDPGNTGQDILVLWMREYKEQIFAECSVALPKRKFLTHPVKIDVIIIVMV